MVWIFSDEGIVNSLDNSDNSFDDDDTDEEERDNNCNWHELHKPIVNRQHIMTIDEYVEKDIMVRETAISITNTLTNTEIYLLIKLLADYLIDNIM